MGRSCSAPSKACRRQAEPVEVPGADGIGEARVDVDYRMTCERDAGGTLVLRVVGKHDQALKRP